MDFDHKPLGNEKTFTIINIFSITSPPTIASSLNMVPVSVKKNISRLISEILKDQKSLFVFSSGLVLATIFFHDSILAYMDFYLEESFREFLDFIVHPEKSKQNISFLIDSFLFVRASLSLGFFEQIVPGCLLRQSHLNSILYFIDSYFRISIYNVKQKDMLKANILHFLWRDFINTYAGKALTEILNSLNPSWLSNNQITEYHRILVGSKLFYSLVEDKKNEDIASFSFVEYDCEALFTLASKVADYIEIIYLKIQ